MKELFTIYLVCLAAMALYCAWCILVHGDDREYQSIKQELGWSDAMVVLVTAVLWPCAVAFWIYDWSKGRP